MSRSIWFTEFRHMAIDDGFITFAWNGTRWMFWEYVDWQAYEEWY